MRGSVTKATLGRLPGYLKYIKAMDKEKTPYVSATVIARALALGEVQVRKDLASVSGEGKPKLGYVAADLEKSIEECLGYTKQTNAVLVGAGKLGKALLDYDEFEQFGVKIIAAFDMVDKAVKFSNSIDILPTEQLKDFIKDNNVQLGIITVGKDAAQSVCDAMVGSGVCAIWNFAPIKLKLPEGVSLRQEDLALSLAHLNKQLRK